MYIIGSVDKTKLIFLKKTSEIITAESKKSDADILSFTVLCLFQALCFFLAFAKGLRDFAKQRAVEICTRQSNWLRLSCVWKTYEKLEIHLDFYNNSLWLSAVGKTIKPYIKYMISDTFDILNFKFASNYLNMLACLPFFLAEWPTPRFLGRISADYVFSLKEK